MCVYVCVCGRVRVCVCVCACGCDVHVRVHVHVGVWVCARVCVFAVLLLCLHARVCTCADSTQVWPTSDHPGSGPAQHLSCIFSDSLIAGLPRTSSCVGRVFSALAWVHLATASEYPGTKR